MSLGTEPQRGGGGFDDFSDFLDYFDNHRHPERRIATSLRSRTVEKAGVKRESQVPPPRVDLDSISCSQTTTTCEPDFQEQTTPQYEKESHCDSFPCSLSFGWKAVRRAPFTDEILLCFLEPSDEATPQRERQDLFEDKVEREVAGLKIRGLQEQEAYRRLLKRYPTNTSRASIKALIEKGRTPGQIRLVAKIRRRCESLVPEFNRIDLWGPKFTSSSNRTISWQLADKLRVAGIHSRLELFRFFRQLVDDISSSEPLRRQFYGALNLAESVLPNRTFDREVIHLGRATPEKERLARAGIQEIWKWQNPLSYALSRKGFPLRNSMAYNISDKSSCLENFVEYRCARNIPPIDVDSAKSISEHFLMRLLREGPISHSMLRSLCLFATAGIDDAPTIAQIMLRIAEKAVWIGLDVWYYRDRPRQGRLPRKANPSEGPTVDQASDYDLGLGFEELQKLHPTKNQREIELELLRLWRSDARELLTVQSAVSRYQENYGKLRIHR